MLCHTVALEVWPVCHILLLGEALRSGWSWTGLWDPPGRAVRAQDRASLWVGVNTVCPLECVWGPWGSHHLFSVWFSLQEWSYVHLNRDTLFQLWHTYSRLAPFAKAATLLDSLRSGLTSQEFSQVWVITARQPSYLGDHMNPTFITLHSSPLHPAPHPSTTTN